MQQNVGFGRRLTFFYMNKERAMAEVKKISWFSSASVANNTAANNTITLDTPAAGKDNFLIGAAFHHTQSAIAYRADHGLSKDLTESGNIQTEAVKEHDNTLMNGIQSVNSDGCVSVGMGFGAKGIKLPNRDIKYLYAQDSGGAESVLHGVDIYYIEDDE